MRNAFDIAAEALEADEPDVVHYEQFVRQHLPDVQRWCVRRFGERDEAMVLAQRIVLDLYRLEARRMPSDFPRAA